jgi:hypothetical protein
MTLVEQILLLFDDLDAFDSVELMQALAERGYELKCNYELGEKATKTKYAVYLSGYSDDSKIICIKAVRNFGSEHLKELEGCINWDLRTTKNFVESDPEEWKKAPLFWGTRSTITFLFKALEQEYNPRVQFEMREMQPK